jgi:hypothetical protein
MDGYPETTCLEAIYADELPAVPPLGLGGLGGPPFEAAEIDLPERSLLALYTDGLIEARDHDIEAGLTRLCRTLAQSSASLEATATSSRTTAGSTSDQGPSPSPLTRTSWPRCLSITGSWPSSANSSAAPS